MLGTPAIALVPAEPLAFVTDPPVDLALVWVRPPRLAGPPGVVCCLCRTSTVGASPAEGVGAGVDGPVVVAADVEVEDGALAGVGADAAVDVLVVD